ncbi:MAG: hypothetical protein JRI49_09180 [Deltaproteobacteria bacterium]|nr:hypothetical protein [Deltaproteobacteria bacterium]
MPKITERGLKRHLFEKVFLSGPGVGDTGKGVRGILAYCTRNDTFHVAYNTGFDEGSYQVKTGHMMGIKTLYKREFCDDPELLEHTKTYEVELKEVV